MSDFMSEYDMSDIFTLSHTYGDEPETLTLSISSGAAITLLEIVEAQLEVARASLKASREANDALGIMMDEDRVAHLEEAREALAPAGDFTLL